MAICCMAGLLRLRLERVYVRLNVEGRYPVTSLTIEASHFIQSIPRAAARVTARTESAAVRA